MMTYKEALSCIDIRVITRSIFCSPEWNKLEDIHHVIIKQNLLVWEDWFLFDRFREVYKFGFIPSPSFMGKFKLKRQVKKIFMRNCNILRARYARHDTRDVQDIQRRWERRNLSNAVSSKGTESAKRRM